MAKKTSKKEAPAKAAKAEKKAPIEKPAKAEGPKYGINDLAKELKVEPASARVKLRKHGIEKVGGRYGWETKDALMAVVKQLKTEPADDEEDEEDVEEDETEDEDEDEDEDDD